jgi:hypothetical protein
MSLSTFVKGSALTVGTLSLIGASSFGSVAIAASLVNGGFESGLTGWTVVNQEGGRGSWYSTHGELAPTTSLSIPAPSEGSQYAVTDQSNIGSHVLFQNIFLEAGATHSLSFQWFANSLSEDGEMSDAGTMNKDAFPNQNFRVDIVSTLFSDWFGPSSTTGVLANILAPVAPSYSSWNRVSFDLTPWAGSSVRLALRQVDNQGYFNAGVDDVSVTSESVKSESVPEPIAILGTIMGLGGMAGVRERQKRQKQA